MKTNETFVLIRSRSVTTLLVATAAVALTFNTRAAKPGGSATQPCVAFDDQPGDSLRSDNQARYCNAPKTEYVTVSFSNDGHRNFMTGARRSVLVDFGAPILVKDGNNIPWTFQSTSELDAAGIEHSLSLFVGSWQDDFNMFSMQLGNVRDINLMFNLFLYFPGQKMAVPVVVKLAPQPLSNERQCEISDAVKVTCTGVDTAGKANAWRVETQDPNNETCVSQKAFGHDLDDLTIGIRNLSFGFTVTR